MNILHTEEHEIVPILPNAHYILTQSPCISSVVCGFKTISVLNSTIMNIVIENTKVYTSYHILSENTQV